jgi:hypothetical protein
MYSYCTVQAIEVPLNRTQEGHCLIHNQFCHHGSVPEMGAEFTRSHFLFGSISGQLRTRFTAKQNETLHLKMEECGRDVSISPCKESPDLGR